MTKSPLAADFDHWLAGCFFNSPTEIVLILGEYVGPAMRARRESPARPAAIRFRLKMFKAHFDDAPLSKSILSIENSPHG